MYWLQRHVPSVVFRVANERWDGGVLGALLEGGQQSSGEVVLQLSAVWRMIRPEPPRCTFAPLVTTPSRRPRQQLATGMLIFAERMTGFSALELVSSLVKRWFDTARVTVNL